MSAAQQNALMLASLLGVDEAVASERLDRVILLTAEPGWRAAWAAGLREILGRTIRVEVDGIEAPDLEVLIGDVQARTRAPCLFVVLGAEGVTVGRQSEGQHRGEPHGLYAEAAACLVTAAALSIVIDDRALPPVRLPLRLRFATLGVPAGFLDRPIDLRDAVLAGAGAVGHGFLRAARHLDLRGELTVVDPKTVQEGILNRCTFLQGDDVGRDKAVALTERAQGGFPRLPLVPRVMDFQSFVRDLGHPPQTVFVAVDSRRARRSIQLELPHRVVDASTTDVRGVVVHSNVLPTDGACLACIYHHVPDEHARERSIAEGLDVDLSDVQQGLISAEAAGRIAATHEGVESADLVGKAYDSLFRQLCAAQALTTPEGRQVLAPFAFVSAWAGVLMAVEMLRSFAGVASTNYWSVDPWNVPLAQGRVRRPRHPDCELCSKPEYEPVLRGLWE